MEKDRTNLKEFLIRTARKASQGSVPCPQGRQLYGGQGRGDGPDRLQRRRQIHAAENYRGHYEAHRRYRNPQRHRRPHAELGSGMDMELSGRENIFLNGAILGFSKRFLPKQA